MNRLIVSAILLLSAAAGAATLSVPSPQYGSIQSAIDDSNDADTITVAAGTYAENIDFLGKAITVRSADPNDPSVVAATVINGSAPADPNFGSVVTFRNGESNASVLSGFTITGGTGSWIVVAWEFKGARWNRCGGGVLCYNMSQPTISKNVFIGNLAGQGGGVYIYGNPVNPNDPGNPPVHIGPIIADNVFINNQAVVEHGFGPPDQMYPANDHGDGGAIVAFQGVDAVITGNIMQNNYADAYGGAVHVRQWSHGTIQQNRIVQNASALGAGIHITYFSNPTLSENMIRSNEATTLGGGGIYVYNESAPVIERNTIIDNSSYNGAGIAVYNESAGRIENNLISKNRIGAGIRVVSSWPVVRFNTIADNARGGISSEYDSVVTFENNIVTSNGSGWGVQTYQGGLIDLSYNDVWGNGLGQVHPDIPDQIGVNGNISVDPRFVDADSNDYHLSYDSWCINSADPNYVDAAVDHDGDSRIMGQYADIGADEAPPVWNITAGGQYQTIQAAVDDANDGQTIVLTVGTHTGDGNRDIDYKGKPLTVRSFDPNSPAVVGATIVDSNGSPTQLHRAFHFHNGVGPDSVVAGLTITGGAGMYEGGAIRCFSNSSPTIADCLFVENQGEGRAGAIYCGNGSNPTIERCIFTGNIATRGYGGAIACFYDSSPVIANCIMFNNIARGEGHHGGGVCCWDGSNAIVANCIVAGNSAGHRGGGLYAYWSDPCFINCTVIGNKALEGGGIGSFRESNPLVANCIVRDNISPDGNQLALINTIRVWSSSIPTAMTVIYSDIDEGFAGATVDTGCTLNWGTGNIDVDPNFVHAGYWTEPNTPEDINDDYFTVGNYHLLPGSLCIDAGDNSSVPLFSLADMDEEPRVHAGSVDMGADEVITSYADLNLDAHVDNLDITILAGQWLLTGSDLPADLNSDLTVDFQDLAWLALDWAWKGGWAQ